MKQFSLLLHLPILCFKKKKKEWFWHQKSSLYQKDCFG